MAWRKSSFSQGASNCVEVDNWRKPTRSKANGACLETGSSAGVIGIRDTKEEHLGSGRTVLTFSPEAWDMFTGKIKGGV